MKYNRSILTPSSVQYTNRVEEMTVSYKMYNLQKICKKYMRIITPSPVKLSEDILLIFKRVLAFFLCFGIEVITSD